MGVRAHCLSARKRATIEGENVSEATPGPINFFPSLSLIPRFPIRGPGKRGVPWQRRLHFAETIVSFHFLLRNPINRLFNTAAATANHGNRSVRLGRIGGKKAKVKACDWKAPVLSARNDRVTRRLDSIQVVTALATNFYVGFMNTRNFVSGGSYAPLSQ